MKGIPQWLEGLAKLAAHRAVIAVAAAVLTLLAERGLIGGEVVDAVLQWLDVALGRQFG